MANTVYVKLGLQGADEIQAALNKLGAAGEAAFAKIRASAEKANPGSGSRLDAGLNKLKESFATVSKAGTAFGKTIDYTSTTFTKFQSNLAATSLKIGALKLAFDTVAGAAFLLGKSAIDTVDELDRQSQALGFSIESYTALVSAAEAASVEQDQLAVALQKVNVFFENQAEAADKASGALQNQIRDIRESNKSSEEKQDAIAKALQKAGDAAEGEVNAIEKLGLSMRELSEATPEERIYLLADAFQRAGSSAKTNAIGVELFGKGALKLVAFLSQGSAEIRKQEAEYKRLGFSVTEAQKQIALLGDNALDKLSLALRGARLQLGLLLAPAITRGANALTDYFADNLEQIKEWGKGVGDTLDRFVQDVILAFKGLDGQVTSKWILTVRDALQSLPVVAEQVIGLLTAAFDIFSATLSPVAKAINAIFGTSFDGKTLGVLVILGKMTGAFKLVGSTIQLLVFAPVNMFIGLIRTIIALGPAVYAALVSIGNILAVVGPAMVAFLAANPALLVIIGTVATLAAGVAYLATRQTELDKAVGDATKGLDEYDAAARRAADGTKEATDALLEKQEALLNERRFAILDAQDAVAAAQARVAEAEANAKEATGYYAAANANSLLRSARAALAEQTAVLAQRETNLAEAQKHVSETKAELLAGSKQLSDAMPKLATATDKAADGFIKIKIHMGSAGVKIQEVPRELDEAARKAIASKNKLDAALKEKSPENDALLEQIRQRADEFVTKMEEITARYRNLGVDLSSSMAKGFDTLPNAMQAAASQAVSIFAGMVTQIEGQISRLRATLASLRAQISAASSAADNSGNEQRRAGGGMIYGVGGPTQDNIPVWASVGEFMIRAAAVKRVPLAFLRALNSGRYDLGDLLHRFSNMRFADGGLVGLPTISLPSVSGAGGSLGGPMSSLTLVLDGQTFAGLSGSPDTIARLERAVKIRKVRATGRPSPYA